MMEFFIQRDKQSHIMVCLVIASITVLALTLFTFLPNAEIFLYAYLHAMAWGSGKEAFDAIRKDGSGWSWMDIVADNVGAITGALLAFIP